VVGGLLGLGYGLIAPAKYQATANIQVGRVAGIDVETPATLVEKLKMPLYYSQKTYLACNVMDEVDPSEEITKTLKPTLSKTAPIVTISYREKSREERRSQELSDSDSRFCPLDKTLSRQSL
jgi:hypothetical protein